MKFSLMQLMALVTAVAVICAAMFALPHLLTVIVLCAVLLCVPTVLISVVFYGQGYGRAFSIGALWGGGFGMVLHLFQAYFVLAVLIEGGFEDIIETADESVTYVRIMFAVVVGFNVVSGLISMGAYWLLRGRKNKPSATAAGFTSTIPEYSVLHGRLESVQFHTAELESEGRPTLSPESAIDAVGSGRF